MKKTLSAIFMTAGIGFGVLDLYSIATSENAIALLGTDPTVALASDAIVTGAGLAIKPPKQG